MRAVAVFLAGLLLSGCAINGVNPLAPSSTHLYTASIPSASGGGRFIELAMLPDGDALFIEAYIDRPKTEALNTGQWQKSGAFIDVTLQDGRKLSFLQQGIRLIYQGEQYGSSGLILVLQQNADAGPGVNVGFGYSGGF